MDTFMAKITKPGRGKFSQTQQHPFGADPATYQAVARPLAGKSSFTFKHLLILIASIVGSNLLTITLYNSNSGASASANASSIGNISGPSEPPAPELYLLDKAEYCAEDKQQFADKVREISQMLGVQPEWLMAVMYSESKFNPGIFNHKGSGAVGLIQFMPRTANELNVSTQRLQNMSCVQQMEYVYMYLERVRQRYGEIKTLTDLYLAILYPKALNQDYCFTLYAKPSKAFRQNSGLDENRDGRVTVSDIDRRMQRLYPTAYVAGDVTRSMLSMGD